MDPEQYITKDEFKMMLDVKESQSQMKATFPQQSALKKKNDLENKQKFIAENQAILKFLSEQLAKDKETPQRFFKKADIKHNGIVETEQLKELVKTTYPDASFGLNLKKLAKALDINGNGLIE